MDRGVRATPRHGHASDRGPVADGFEGREAGGKDRVDDPVVPRDDEQLVEARAERRVGLRGRVQIEAAGSAERDLGEVPLLEDRRRLGRLVNVVELDRGDAYVERGERIERVERGRIQGDAAVAQDDDLIFEIGVGELGRLAERDVEAGARARRVRTYREVRDGECGALDDAWGWISIIRFGASAAELLGVRIGDPIWVTAAD